MSEKDPTVTERLVFTDQAEITGQFFDNQHDDFISYDEVISKDIFLGRQPFDVNPYSPTPLDPFHLRTAGSEYFLAAGLLMESRLNEAANKAGVPEDIYSSVFDEIMFEHVHRSDKNNIAMRILREAYANQPRLDRSTANKIIAARAGLSGISQLGHILASVRKMGGIEVMKYTKPFDTRDCVSAHAKFIHSMRLADNEDPTFTIIGDIQTSNQRILNTAKNVGSHIVVTKGKEADVLIDGQHLELIGRYSYVALDSDLPVGNIQSNLVRIGNRTANVQPISIAKYLRIAQED